MSRRRHREPQPRPDEALRSPKPTVQRVLWCQWCGRDADELPGELSDGTRVCGRCTEDVVHPQQALDWVEALKRISGRTSLPWRRRSSDEGGGDAQE